MTNDTGGRLTLYILGAIVLALGLAFLVPELAMRFEVGGDIFLRLLTMMVVPLVMASVMSGIIGLGDVRKLGRPGGAAIGYYLTTTVLAVTIGLVMVNLIQPGVGAVDPATLAAMTTALKPVFLRRVSSCSLAATSSSRLSVVLIRAMLSARHLDVKG